MTRIAILAETDTAEQLGTLLSEAGADVSQPQLDDVDDVHRYFDAIDEHGLEAPELVIVDDYFIGELGSCSIEVVHLSGKRAVASPWAALAAAGVELEAPAQNFGLNIALGNAAMLTADDVAGALDKVAGDLRAGHRDGVVRDVNGNTVGRWSL